MPALPGIREKGEPGLTSFLTGRVLLQPFQIRVTRRRIVVSQVTRAGAGQPLAGPRV